MGLFSRHISLADSGIYKGLEDCHSHLLPGVDDGVQTLEESLEILGRLETLGVRSVWFTPHVMEDIPNATEELKQHFDSFKQAYQGKVELNLAAEYMLDELFAERFEQKDLLPIKRNMLLVETSYFNPPVDLNKTLDRVRAKGYFPLLAHPERYNYMEWKDYTELKGLGVKFQLNLPSLGGLYGPQVQRKAQRLLKEGMYETIGSDIHSIKTINTTININYKITKHLYEFKK